MHQLLVKTKYDGGYLPNSYTDARVVEGEAYQVAVKEAVDQFYSYVQAAKDMSKEEVMRKSNLYHQETIYEALAVEEHFVSFNYKTMKCMDLPNSKLGASRENHEVVISYERGTLTVFHNQADNTNRYNFMTWKMFDCPK